MRIEINIEDRHVLIILLFIIAASAIGLVMAYGGSAPAAMGHSWSEMECNGCITAGNLAANSVTAAKIQDGTITNADVASIDGSKITGTVSSASSAGNADTLDGMHAGSFSINCPCGTCFTTAIQNIGCSDAWHICTPSGWQRTSLAFGDYCGGGNT